LKGRRSIKTVVVAATVGGAVLPVLLLLVWSFSKGWLWPGMWAAVQLGQVKTINWAKFCAGAGEARRSPFLQSHGAFHFLLDYVPRWHWMTRPGGLIQFQPFVPKQHGERVLRTLIERCQQAGMVPYLGVLKRHRPDPFLMTHAVDGYSLAMDLCVSMRAHRRQALWRLCQELAEIVLTAGGRFYYAKDAVLLASLEGVVTGHPAHRGVRGVYYAENWEDAQGFSPYIYYGVKDELDQWRSAVTKYEFVGGKISSFPYLEYYEALATVRGAVSGGPGGHRCLAP